MASGPWARHRARWPALSVAVAYVLSPLHRGSADRAATATDDRGRSLVLALAAYVILLLLAFAVNLIEPLEQLMDSVVLQLEFPAVATALGWTVPAETGRAISVFGHAGAILFYAGLIAFLLYRAAGYFESPTVWRDIWTRFAGPP